MKECLLWTWYSGGDGFVVGLGGGVGAGGWGGVPPRRLCLGPG